MVGIEQFEVTIRDTGTTYRCAAGQSLLAGMERLGKRGIPVGCRGGGCGVCKVAIVSGRYETRVMSSEHVSAEDRHHHHVLSCRAFPTSDVSLEVLGSMRKTVCR